MRSFKTSDGLNLAFRDEGSGTPVLCLAGLTRNSRDFDFLKQAIGDEIRLIRLDYRGRGESDFDPNYSNYSIPIEARDVVELINYINLPKVVIVGTSRGGLIAMMLAATVKDRLAGVLLNDIGPELDQSGLEKIMGYLGRNPSYKTFDEASKGLPEFYADQYANLPKGRWAECAEMWWDETPTGLKINYDPKLRDAILESSATPTPDLWPLFDALSDIPIALVRGANSDLLSEDTTAKMRTRRPDMTYANIPDRGHVPFLDESEAIAALRTLLLKVDL